MQPQIWFPRSDLSPAYSRQLMNVPQLRNVCYLNCRESILWLYKSTLLDLDEKDVGSSGYFKKLNISND